MRKTKIELERERFGARLRLALEQAGHQSIGATDLHRHLKMIGMYVTVCAVRKWLMGESIPTQDKMTVLARWLGKAPDWLRFGTGDGETVIHPGKVIAPRTLRMMHGFEQLVERDRVLVQTMIDSMLQNAATERRA